MSALAPTRDDGPLARALARVPGGRLSPSLLVVVAVLAPFAAIVAGGAAAGRGSIALALGWMVVLGGASAGGDLARDRFRWAVPPLLRAGEYAALLWVGAAAGSLPAAFALCAALAFRHYDLVYRPRFTGAPPARWTGEAALGWDGRLVLGWALLAAGALPAGFYALAALLGLLFASESAFAWSRTVAAGVRPTYHEEGEAE